jgi:cytochrome c
LKRFAGLVLLLAACNREQKSQITASTGGNIDNGRKLVQQYGCTSCHDIPNVSGPRGMVGPPLTNIGSRQVIAGKFPNTPANMIAYLKDPQAADAQNVMPNLGLTDAQSRDIAAFLYTLK